MSITTYETCMQKAAYFVIPDPGFLQVSGEDRLAFLQRQTTNDMRTLSPGRTLLTILTSPTARILDVFYTFEENQPGSSPVLNLISLPGQSEKTDSFLRSRIFFMDKVSLKNASSYYAQIDLIGPQAINVLQQLGAETATEPDQVTFVDKAGLSFRYIQQKGLSGPGYRLWTEKPYMESLIKALDESGIPPLSPEIVQILCIEAGIPQSGTELTEAFTPLEIGFTEAVSMNKGCYTGQEIIARQVNYDKVTRHLAGISLDAPVNPGDTVYVDDKPVGSVTSTAISPRFGSIALAVLRRPYNEPGTSLVVGQAIPPARAIVTPLPFPSS